METTNQFPTVTRVVTITVAMSELDMRNVMYCAIGYLAHSTNSSPITEKEGQSLINKIQYVLSELEK